jgi:VanZ family protein
LLWIAFNFAWTTALLVPDPDGWARSWLLSESDGPEAREHLDEQLFLFSKALHVSAYAVLAILSGRLRVSWPYRILLLLFMSTHAFGTEWLQNFIHERHPSLRDVGLDHLGMACGILLSRKCWFARPAAGSL